MHLAFAGLPSGPETTLVAANHLLASVARHQFTSSRLREKALTWERPEVFSLDAWVAAVWQEVRFSGADVPGLLSPAQEALLWRSIIHQRVPSLFDADATAGLARRAAAAITQWQIPLDHELWADHQDGQQFLDWWRTLRSRCRDSGWITRSDLWRLLPQWRERGWWKPGPVALLGFDSLPPALSKLCALLPGVRVFGCRAESDTKPAIVPAFECQHVGEELELSARWARAQYERNPKASLAVFVPELSANRKLVRRLFQDVFYPGAALDFAAESAADCVFHLDGSEALLSHPLVANAYLMLDLAKRDIEQRSASAILRCPFIVGAEPERGLRALADIQLRRDRELELPLKTLQRIARDCPLLSKALDKVARLVREMRPTQRVSAWAQFVSDLLEALGWPGDAELSADEQSVVGAWKDAVSELGSLAAVAGPLTFAQLLDALRRVLASASGVGPGTLASPIQILDSQSAVGLRFDAAAVTGLGEETWPAPIRFSPLIPLGLQVQQGVPGAGAASFREEARRSTAALFSVALVVHATFHGTLTPLARPFAEARQNELPVWPGRRPLDSFAAADIEVIADTDAPPFQIVEIPVAGGTSIIRSQSHCPFQAFAKHRLGVREMKYASFGYDPMDRGNFVHRSLERIWKHLQTQAQLQAMDAEELRELVAGCVADALQSEIDEGVFATQTLIAEQQRVTQLILDWLNQVERARPAPFVVEQLETELQFNTAGLPLKIRIDRIDRLRDDSVLLLDYKTGRPAQKDLNCPRPKEPQLLVYAAASESKVAGVYFAKVKARELKLIGYGPHEKRGSQWDGARSAEAREEVEGLARDFLAGRAAVHPRNGACSWCEVKPLCRVSEQAGESAEECE